PDYQCRAAASHPRRACNSIQPLSDCSFCRFYMQTWHARTMSKARKLFRYTRIRTDISATSAVEFAMLAPLFILFLLGMVAYGIYFGASHSVQQIAADAARTAISGLDAAERKTLVADYVARNAAGYPFVDSAKLTVDAR